MDIISFPGNGGGHPTTSFALVGYPRSRKNGGHMDRKPVWINGRKVFVLPWARVWDVLMALPADDFRAVWTARAYLVDVDGTRISPNEIVYSGQKISVCRDSRDSEGNGVRPPISTGNENSVSGSECCPEHP